MLFNISKDFNNNWKTKNSIKNIRFHLEIIKIKINAHKKHIFEYLTSFT